MKRLMNEDLRKWFREKWVRMDTRGNIKGDCAREPGEGKPKCLPLAKARAMDKKDRAAAAQRKRREDPIADRGSKGNKPINVATEEIKTSELIKRSHEKRGAPGTLKAKIKGPITLQKVRALKNKPDATTLDKKQANFYINMHSEEYLQEKSTPTNPGLWAKAKALAKSKFDVYPSAYANGWAAKWYKSKGGGWKSMSEQREYKILSFKKYVSEAVFVPTMKQGTSKQAYLGSKATCSSCGESKEKSLFKMVDGKEMCKDCQTDVKEERALGKPYRTPGGPKKFAVHVKNERGNVVKVTFGDPNLSIKRDSPERRKAFRARHNCADPGPRTKARYWSCRQWRASAKVEA